MHCWVHLVHISNSIANHFCIIVPFVTIVQGPWADIHHAPLALRRPIALDALDRVAVNGPVQLYWSSRAKSTRGVRLVGAVLVHNRKCSVRAPRSTCPKNLRACMGGRKTDGAATTDYVAHAGMPHGERSETFMSHCTNVVISFQLLPVPISTSFCDSLVSE